MENLEATIGFKIAMTFKPFIDKDCIEHMEIVKDMARSINKNIPDNTNIFSETEVIRAVKMARKLSSDFLSTDIVELLKINRE